jgi:NADH-quinone oxidoreductase subunit G
MAETVKLFVNGQEVEVESGKNLIDAFKVIGIEIPHFCYHPALGADGNCRMCLVGIEDGRPPLVPACKTPVSEGLKVQLDTEKIKKIQHDVMELELINHPTDCPVCDQAGECTLQDYYMSYDHQASRMRVPQVLKGKKMDFGCGVIHDQERCVLCARCVRFTRLITKTGELGIVNRSDEARVTLFPGRPLNNRYALNVVDLCPVGAMTSKDFRFKQRAWFLKRNKGICHGCAKGCNIFIDHNREKYGDDLIYRFRPRHNPQVNGYFICDEGRLSYHQENEGRLTTARVDHEESSTEQALQIARRRIEGSDKLLILVSPNCSVEQLLAIKALASKTGAALSGYSQGYIKEGSGDDFLIRDDKSANRAGLAILDIDSSLEFLESAIQGANTLVNFNNDLFAAGINQACSKKLGEMQTIMIGSHDTAFSRQAGIAIPTASYSEYEGSVINCDGILQSFGQAVSKNNPALDMVRIVGLLGGTLTDRAALLQAMKRSIPAFAAIATDQIPEEGLKLTDNEAVHVTA